MSDFLKNICVSISGPAFTDCLKQISGCQLAELRFDLVDLNETEIKDLVSTGIEWIITVRSEFLEQPDFEKKFNAALNNMVRFVDVDYTLMNDQRAMNLMKITKASSKSLLLSYHNTAETPVASELVQICNTMNSRGADAIKIVCLARSGKDVDTIRNLYAQFEKITAFCFGTIGRETRIEALFRGIRLSYVYSDSGKSTAPGQYSFTEMCTFAEIAEKKVRDNE
ncbi:3-dehydroquinate dehydratase [bioreactor metagenome]|uniref:3-dehydroquinate dehydratase n=1 Tax=bioreactor metagenome TaxID=1076179 RepID=A0A645CNW7_9ZZZZ